MNRVTAFITILCLSATVCKAQVVTPLPATPKTPVIDLSPMSFTIGDANGDGVITDGDVSAIADYIVGKESETFDVDGADTNLDGKINIADATIIIDYLIERAVELSRQTHSASYSVGSGIPAKAKASRRSTQVPQRPQ